MPVLYVRTTDEIHKFVSECAAESGVSISEVANVILEAARRRGWRITRAAAQIKEPE
jgi:hypothetical protein